MRPPHYLQDVCHSFKLKAPTIKAHHKEKVRKPTYSHKLTGVFNKIKASQNLIDSYVPVKIKLKTNPIVDMSSL